MSGLGGAGVATRGAAPGITTPEPGARPRVPQERPPPEHARGVRVERLRSRRRARLRRQLGGVALVTVLLAGAMVATTLLRSRVQVRHGQSPRAQGPAPAAAGAQQTWLLVGTVDADPSGRADWLALMSHDPAAARSLVLYLPRTTLAELPGHGTDTLAEAFAFGREPLVCEAVSNLLGVRVDHVLRISDRQEQALFDALGPVTVDVGRDLAGGGPAAPGADAGVAFPAGVQELTGARASAWLGLADGDEITRSVRHAAFWEALLVRHGGAGAPAFGRAVAAARIEYATDAPPADVDRFFEDLASPGSSGRFFETLPVHAAGPAAGRDTGSTLYAIDHPSLDALVDGYLAGARLSASGATGRLVQILNGNGVPGIGQSVAGRLIPKGFRIVLDDNARRFDHTTTQIVVHAGDAQARALGEEVRTALGVGEIVVGHRRQGLVDVTVVVGSDFVAGAGERAA